MTAQVIDGKTIALEIRNEVAADAACFENRAKRKAALAVVLVGTDPASEVYVGSKIRSTREAGMGSFEHRLPADTSEAGLLALIRRLNDDPAVDGILVQLPLPRHIDSGAVISSIDPAKDVDGLHPENVGRLMNGLQGLSPCTPLGSMLLIERTMGDVAGLEAVVIGRSVLVGKPLGQMLLAANATVTMAHSRTRNLAALCRRADILVAAVGQPEMVRGNWIKPGASVIDVGINRVASFAQAVDQRPKGRLVGDVAFAEAKVVAGAITPVPGGVGPMTIACLLRNTLIAAKRRNRHLPGYAV